MKVLVILLCSAYALVEGFPGKSIYLFRNPAMKLYIISCSFSYFISLIIHLSSAKKLLGGYGRGVSFTRPCSPVQFISLYKCYRFHLCDILHFVLPKSL